MKPHESATLVIANLGDLAADPLGVVRRLAVVADQHAAVEIVGVVEPSEWGAVRRLLLSLAAVDQSFRREQIRRGIAARARRERPTRVDGAQIASLRAEGRSWREIAAAVSCSVRTARRALARDAARDAGDE